MAGDAAGPFHAVDGGVRIAVRLTPKAAHNRVQGIAVDGAGASALRVSVTAVAEKGQANAALIRLLAREWRVARRDLEIVAGHHDRRKVLHLAGDPKTGLALLTGWFAERRRNE
ncbi:MAG: DUF167 domain-containing protein [Alphaproteobacteria bacterium]|nr:DUF167 domain-containing protein [Alphaproteobacteria bacterium]